MKFVNAHAGVNKMFIGEILQVVSAFTTLLAVLLGVTALGAYEAGASEGVVAGTAAGAFVFLLPGALCSLVGQVLGIVGLWQASKDEQNYLRKAFWALIASLVLSFVVAMFTNAGHSNLFVSFLSLLSTLCALVVFNFSIEGIGRLGSRAGDDALLAFGRKLMMWFTIALVCSLIASIFANWLGAIAAGISAVLVLVVYVGYVVFLARARKALA